mgnify:CR=1 FL=1
MFKNLSYRKENEKTATSDKFSSETKAQLN